MEVSTYTSLRNPEWYEAKNDTLVINSKEELLNSILYFGLFTSQQKHKFAFDINRKLREYGVKLQLTKDHAFYKHAQSANYSLTLDLPPYVSRVLFSHEKNMAKSLVDDYDFKAKRRTQEFMKKFINANDFHQLQAFIEELFNFLIDSSPEDFIDTDISDGSPFFSIISIVNSVRSTLSDFACIPGNVGLEHLRVNRLSESLIDDVANGIANDIASTGSFSANQLGDLRLLFTKSSIVKYVMNLREIQIIALQKIEDKSRASEVVDLIEMEIVKTFETKDAKTSGDFPKVTYLPRTVKLLESQRNEHKSYLDIINGYNHSYVITESFTPNPELSELVNSLSLNLYPKHISTYSKQLSLSVANRFALSKLDIVKNIIDIDSAVDTQVSLAYVDKGLCIACDGDKPGTVKLIELTDGTEESLDVIEYLTTEESFVVPKAFVHTVKVNVNGLENKESLTEGLTIDSDGNIHFKFNKNISYMDQYAENHKVLLQNAKSENWDGVKTNLAVAFTIISEIERKVIYTKKQIGVDKRKEAEKARMFLINDFKTHLRLVQKNDPTFNFSEYYEKSNLGKLNLTLSRDGIIGIKKLVQTIILL